MITYLDIDSFLGIIENTPLCDVRSPGEYHHAHLPRAISLPLFTDEERAQIGTTYKQQSKSQAIKEGLDAFGPKMRYIVEQVEAIIKKTVPDYSGNQVKKQCIAIYCWRGGMRSSAVAWLLDLYGFDVYVLSGGYKSFRKYALDALEEKYQFKILGGHTGAGKTDYLYYLQNQGDTILDLEDLASHRGSAFGHLGMGESPSQEMFENKLGLLLQKMKTKEIWLEDESQRIGYVYIPKNIYDQMQSAPLYLLKKSFEERLEFTIKGYSSFDKEDLISAVGRISKRLGGLEAQNAIQHISDGRIKEAFSILLTYYDKWYDKNLEGRELINL